VGRSRDPEIDDFGAPHVALGNDDVVGRDIAMDDSPVVRRLQAGGQPLHQRTGRLERERTVVAQNIVQRAAVDEFHGQVRPLQNRFDGEHVVTDDGVVLEIVQGGGFLAKQGERRFVFDQFSQHHLDGHRISGLDGVAFVDLAHAAGADLALDLIDAVEPRAGGNPGRA
jgi:hypothetical protein